MKVLNVGIVGLGTVGGGAYNVIKRNQVDISRRIGCKVVVTHVGTRSLDKAKAIIGNDDVQLTDDAFAVVNNPDVDVVLELIGGDTLAKDLVLKAIANGKHVVTANKALLAEYGNEIFTEAAKQGVMVAYEASVAGGIPIIKALREGLTANSIQWLAGIINGTTNFILTEMRDKGLAFADVLGEAQRLGYAEADPTFDVEGVDAAHKLALMASIAFGMPIKFDAVYTEGITQLQNHDIQYASQLGYNVKLLGIAKKTDAGVELRVHPTLIPKKRLVANVDGAMNAVVVQGDAVGPTLYYGAGAGAEPTASAVVADVVDIARLHGAEQTHRVADLGFQPDQQIDLPVLPITEVYSAYYLSMDVLNQSGVLAKVTQVLADKDISIDAVIQPQESQQDAHIVILTNLTQEKHMNAAIAAIEALEAVEGNVTKIRMESLGN